MAGSWGSFGKVGGAGIEAFWLWLSTPTLEELTGAAERTETLGRPPGFWKNDAGGGRLGSLFAAVVGMPLKPWHALALGRADP